MQLTIPLSDKNVKLQGHMGQLNYSLHGTRGLQEQCTVAFRAANATAQSRCIIHPLCL